MAKMNWKGERMLHIKKPLVCLSIKHCWNGEHPRKYFSNLHSQKKSFLRNICERLKNTTLLFGNILINAIVIFRISPSKMMAPRWLNCNRLKTFSCTGMKISRCGKKGLLRMYLNPSCNMRNNWIGNKNTEPRGNNSAWKF